MTFDPWISEWDNPAISMMAIMHVMRQTGGTETS